jgi:endonuclease/exonuclease/phosphatase family metal-dependent hydrolase
LAGSPTPAPDSSASVVVRVATFNARHGVNPRGRVSNRGLVETCRSLDADVLALQELDQYVFRSWFRDQAAMVARALGRKYAVARARRAPLTGWQCNALCVRGKIADVEVVELPRRPEHEQRVALLTQVELSGTALSTGCTHLQHRGHGAAREQLEFVLEALSTRPRPRLLAGDLNLAADVAEPLLAAHGYHAAESGPTFPAAEPRRRIDWIAVDDRTSVLGARIHAPLVGDHCPLVADVAVAAGA